MNFAPEIILGFLGTLVTAYFGYKRYLQEKQFNYYRENIKNLFSTNKEEILASIATLGIFKNVTDYKKSTIDTLINRLYTELDYDISNAISDVLTQVVTGEEAIYVSKRLIEINRNFFVQTFPLSKRKTALEDIYKLAEKKYLELKSTENGDKEVIGNWHGLMKEKWGEFNSQADIVDYKLLWHKQILADTLGMILRKSTELNLPQRGLRFYQNDFNNCNFSGVTIENCFMDNSAFSQSALTDVTLRDIDIISDTTFTSSSISDCRFIKGFIKRNVFANALFTNVLFDGVAFEDVYFPGATIENCEFRNVTGLKPEQFYKAKLKNVNFNNAVDLAAIQATTYDKVSAAVNSSTLYSDKQKEIMEWVDWLAKQETTWAT